MEAIAALGLACNVMQLIDFSGEVISIARHAYSAGSVEDDLSDRVSRLVDLSTAVKKSLSSASKPATAAQRDLEEIARKCHHASVELQDEIKNLCPPAGGKRSVVRAIGTSLKTVARKGRLKKLEDNMLQWQKAMDSGLLLRICSINEAQALASLEDFEKLDVTLRKVIEQLAQGHSKLMEAMANESSAIQTHVTAEISKSRDELAQRITAQAKETRDGVSQSLSNLHLTAATEARREKLLRSLKYIGMNQRENVVKESFPDTFKWIFSQDLTHWDSFTAWLGSDEKLYWISGKPGSGKSTLMKFITNGKETKEFLKPNTLILSHYLWRPGNPMQKSIRGLLQTLLYQLLREETSLIDLLLRTVKDVERKDHDSDWSFPELKSSLEMTLSASPQPMCIFLDGLDEVSSSDGPSELMGLIEEISKIPHVKTCVASRPEPAYRKRYNKCPKLRLQDLTRLDIEKVCEHFLRSLKDDIPDEWNISRPGEPSFRHIVVDLTTKAEGVFLWVHLALKSIQRGCSNSDSWEEILQRIDKLPAGLDELYHSMWERANVDQGIYEHGAALYLNLVLEARKTRWNIMKHDSLSVFELMAATEPSVQAAILEGQGQMPTPDDLKKRCDFLMKKIDSHCAGLIEFNPLPENRWHMFDPGEWDALVPLSDMEVAFIHRTACDFLTETQGGKDILERDTTSQVDRLLKLLRGSMTQYSMWTIAHPLDLKSQPHEDYGKLELDIYRFYDIMIAISSSRATISESAAETLLRSCETIWNARLPGLKVDVPGVQLPDFLGHAAGNGFYIFVRARVEEAERSANQRISQAYRDYLLHQASLPVIVPAGPESQMRVFGGKHRLAQWLLQENANPSSSWFNAWSWTMAYLGTVWLMPPIMNMIVRGIDNLLELEHDMLTLELTQQSCDIIKQILKLGPIIDHKIAFQLGFRDTFHKPVLFYTFGLVRGETRWSRAIFLEANTLFLLQFFVDLIRFHWPSTEGADEFVSSTLGQDAGRIWDGDTKPSVRLVSYYPSDDRDHCGFWPSSPSYLDTDILRPKLLDSVKYLNDKTKLAEVADGLFSLMAETAKGAEEVVKTTSQFREPFQEYAFFSWPAPEKYAMAFPPPMFNSEKESDNTGTPALGEDKRVREVEGMGD